MTESRGWKSNRCGRSAPCRPATTLIEVLGTLSVLLLLGVSAAGILGSITEIGIRTNNAQQRRGAIQRLADSVRRDAHQARRAECEQGWPMDLIMAGATVRYDWNAPSHSIQRTVLGQNSPQAFDRFRLPDRCSPRVSIDGGRVIIVLWESESAGQPWIIEASLK